MKVPRQVAKSKRTTALVLLVAIAVFALAAVMTSQMIFAQEKSGTIHGLTLSSDDPGTLAISWDIPDPEPSDYRISWAPDSESYVSYKDANTDTKGNSYPSGSSTSHTLSGLPEGVKYKVRMRARYNAGEYANNPWSGPWVKGTGFLASEPEPPTATPEPTEEPTPEPTGEPTPEPTPGPNPTPEGAPKPEPTPGPTGDPGSTPTPEPTPGTTPAPEDGDGVETLVSNAQGELTVSWETPWPQPADYRVSWAPAGEDFLSGENPNETERGNLYPASGESSVTLTALTPESRYRVRVLARYQPDEGGEDRDDPRLSSVTSSVTAIVESITRQLPPEPEPEPEPARELLWSQTITVEELDPNWPVAYRGISVGSRLGREEWKIATMPSGAALRMVNAATAGAGEHLYFTTTGPVGEYLHDRAALLVAGEREYPLAEAMIADATTIGGPRWWTNYVWPGGGQDWAVGEEVELKLYRLPGESAVTPPRLGLPVAVPRVDLIPAGGGSLTVTWQAPANAAEARVADYHVFLKRAGDGWSQSERQVFTPSGEVGEALWATYAGLEPGVRYVARVYARNMVALGPKRGESGTATAPEPVPEAPKHVPAAPLSSLSLTGVPGLEFEPGETRYFAQVDPGVAETTVDFRPAEEGAATEVFVVRGDGSGTGADPGDADPEAGGHQALLSAEGDTLVLLKVTSANDARQDIYGVILAQRVGSQDNGGGQPDSKQSRQSGLNGRAPRNPDTRSTSNVQRTSVERARLGSLSLKNGDQAIDLTRAGHVYRATVPHAVSQVTVVAAEAHGGAAWTLPGDADPDLAGSQVNLRSSGTGGVPRETAISIIVDFPNPGYGTKNYYALIVTREGPPESDATLRSRTVNRNSPEMESALLGSLAVAGTTIFPAFSSDVLAYSAFVGNDQARVTITATGENQGSTVAVNLTDQDATATGYQLDLEEGRNTIIITVTEMDGMTTREYELTVFRTPTAADTTGFLQVDAGWMNYCGLRVDHTLDCGFWWGGGAYAYAGWRNITGNVPRGVFERVSVKRYAGCALRSDGSQQCWGNLIAARKEHRTGPEGGRLQHVGRIRRRHLCSQRER